MTRVQKLNRSTTVSYVWQKSASNNRIDKVGISIHESIEKLSILNLKSNEKYYFYSD